ncbi:MICAL-like protein 2 [Eleginops maclovinus]|uniref:MICAL-like protein 2 n=1 Tax=Eleginops maclovinus TaxID=56733 RepID=UPI003080EFCE
MSAVKALQQWCRVRCDGYRDVTITNMTTSFRDGMAFCALIHKHRPDLINFDSLKKEDVYENNKLAFKVAEEELGIPALLDAEDMVALKVPDRLSILTYVSQYYNYFHGRSPIGGMGGIGGTKRSADAPSDAPSGKKNQPVVAKVFGSSKPARENSPPPSANITRPSSSPRQTRNTTKDVVVEKPHQMGTLSNKCASCDKHVHLVQRHLVEGKLYHRHCAKAMSPTNPTAPFRGLPTTTPVSRFSSLLEPTQTKPASQTPSTPPSYRAHTTPSTPPSYRAHTTPSTPPSYRAHPTPSTPPTPPTPPTYRTHTTKPTPLTNAASRLGPSWLAEKPSPSPSFSTTFSSSSPSRPASSLSSAAKQTPTAVVSKPTATRTTNVSIFTTTPTNQDTKTPSSNKTTSAIFTTTPSSNKTSTSTSTTTPLSNKMTTTTPSSNKTTSSIFTTTPSSNKTTSSIFTTTPSSNKTTSSIFTTTPSSNKTTPSIITTTPTVITTTPSINTTTKSTTTTTTSNDTRPVAAPRKSTTAAKTLQSKLNFFKSDNPAKEEEKKTITTSIVINKGPDPSDTVKKNPAEQAVTVVVNVGDLDKKQANVSWGTGEEKSKAAGGEGDAKTKASAAAIISKKLAEENNNNNSKPAWTSVSLKKTDKSPQVETPKKDPEPARGRRRLKADPSILADMQIPLVPPSPAASSAVRTRTPERPAANPRSASPNTAASENTGSPADWRSKLKPVSKPAAPSQSSKTWANGSGKPQSSDPPPSSHLSSPSISVTPPAAKGFLNGQKGPTANGTKPESTITKKKPDYIQKEDIIKELQDIEDNLNEWEGRGVELEMRLRSSEAEGEDDAVSDELMIEWFTLIRNKQVAMRRESELVYIGKTQDLEEEQPSVEQELRRLMEKPEHLKTSWEKKREEQLMAKLMEIVNDRNAIIEGLDEDRLREEEEDESSTR